MTRDNDDRSTNRGVTTPGKGAKNTGTQERREPTFSRFEDDDYEEPERDADYVAAYHTDDIDDDEDYDDEFSDDDDDEYYDEDEDDEPQGDDAPDTVAADTWQAKANYFDDDNAPHSQSWPLGLIAVAVLALVLLVAGGYGVMQQRAATADELQELRAALATTTAPQGGDVRRGALQKLQQDYDALASEAEALRLENRTLTDTVAGLEKQLGNQQTLANAPPTVTAQAKPVAAKPAEPTAQPVAQPAPSPAKPAAPKAPAAVGPWFVNFGSYAERDVAERWAAKLRPGAGEVIVMPIASGGKTLYRLRVIGLTDGASAKQVARKLESDLGVADLWVGKE